MTAQEEKFHTPSHLTKWLWIAPGVSWSGWRTTPLNSLQESLISSHFAQSLEVWLGYRR
jgi:hypothetical protein